MQTDDHTTEKISLIARGGMLVFGLIWTSGVASMLFFIARELNQEIRQALVYKPVTGAVTAYTPPETKTDEFGEDESTEGVIEYRYVAAGKARDAKHHQGGQFANEYSRKLYRAFETGDKIEAWYDPDDPEISTLEPIAEPQLLGFIIFMLPFIAIGLRTLQTALTGNGPQMDFSRRRSGGRGMSVNMRGTGPYFGVFVGLCAVSAFAFLAGSMFVSWKTGWVIGLGWLLVGIPLITFALGRIFSNRKKSKAPKPVETDSPEPVETIGIEDSVTETPASRLPSGRKKLIGAAAFTLFWCGITSVFLVFVVYGIYKSHDARNRFVSTEGEVIASKVKTNPGDSDSGPTYEPLIKYRYVVNGREHTSMRYAYGSFASSSNHGNASEIVDDHPPGRKITVWYDPRKPTEATISLETPSLCYFLLLFLQPFILVGIGGIVYTVTTPYRFRRDREFLTGEMRLPWAIPCWGTLRQDIQGIVLYPSRAPLFAFAMGYGLTCFFSIFAVVIHHGLILGDLETMASVVIGRVFAIAAGVGVVSLLTSLFRRKTQFEIDENLASLHLKSSKREFTVSFAEIDHWFLRMVTRSTTTIKDSGGKNTRRAPLLALMTTDGTERPIHVFGTSDEQGLIAEKVAMEFAKFTAKPFEGMKTGKGPPATKPTVSGVFSAIRAQTKSAKQYSDLN
ncbi:MAG: DUF3592 domain-containing protein [Phycisphaerae bacterium]|nr:DUF3592 domain-containing protein [Phycisphaerae bacterium]